MCKLCNGFYNGESERPLHERLMEHLRAANNPSSYSDNSVGQHYRDCHPGVEPQLEFEILDRQTVTIRRKISEAIRILEDKPAINDRDELFNLVKFIVQ